MAALVLDNYEKYTANGLKACVLKTDSNLILPCIIATPRNI